MASPFDRDLGYLQAFLLKLEAHAAGLPPAQAEALTAALDQQKQAWAHLSTLLADDPQASSSQAAPETVGAPSSARPPARGGGWTVGSLKKGHESPY